MKRLSCLGAVVFAVSTAIASTAAADGHGDRAAAWRGFNAHFEACYSVHGYNPQAAEGLGDYELGNHELEWRDCVYQGVEKFLVPGAQDPAVFTNLIAIDKEMTEKIKRGEITRQRREEKIKGMVAKVKADEVDAIAASVPAATAPSSAASSEEAPKESKTEFTRKMIDSMRGLGHHM